MHLRGCHLCRVQTHARGRAGPSVLRPWDVRRTAQPPREGLHHTLPGKLGGSPRFWSKGWRPLDGVRLSRVGVGPRPICLELDGNGAQLARRQPH